MNICVIGLGKIGLPLAVHFAKMGNSVIGSDINKSTVDLVNSGNEPFPEEENLQQFLNEVIRNKRLSATTDNMDAMKVTLEPNHLKICIHPSALETWLNSKEMAIKTHIKHPNNHTLTVVVEKDMMG